MKIKTIILILFISIVTLATCDFLSILGNQTQEYSNTTGGNITGVGYSEFLIDVTDAGAIDSIEKITLTNLSYSEAKDLTISLESPGGREKTLVSQKGGSNDYTGDYIFVDDSDDSGLSHIVTYSGDVVPETYQAEGDLDDFEGNDIKGNWKLRIYDNTSPTDGSIDGWSIRIQYEEY